MDAKSLNEMVLKPHKIQTINMKSTPKTRHRRLRTLMPGPGPNEFQEIGTLDRASPLIDLASNDYLGLSRHPEVIEAAYVAMHSQGVGSGGSRFITGSRPIHKCLEENLAQWIGRKRTFLFPSGFQANLAAVLALANRHTPVIADRLVHHSLLIGVNASKAKLHRYAHNDLKQLKRILQECLKKDPHNAPLVITESLFSMEGSSPSILQLVKLCETHGAKLLVDEAHALGVIGPKGKGLCHGLTGPSIMISGTFGKAFGCGGAFLAMDSLMGDHIIQNSGAFRYTTALAPPLAAGSLMALKLIEANPEWALKLQERAKHWRAQLTSAGWPRPPGYGPILSLLVGPDKETLALQSELELSGLLCAAIRPPTVPEGTSRLRIVLRRDLPNDSLRKLISVLKSQ